MSDMIGFSERVLTPRVIAVTGIIARLSMLPEEEGSTP